MSRRRRIYEGTGKTLFEGPEAGTLVQYFKDELIDPADGRPVTVTGKGVLNNRISEYVMSRLNELGIPTHFLRRLNMREQLVRQVEIIPLIVSVRNAAAGEFAERFGIEPGTQLPRSIVEYYYKSNELGNPMITEEHITAFGWAQPTEIDEVLSLVLRINDFLTGLFLGTGLRLVDFTVEFGRLWQNDELRILLADEISPDNCRLLDYASGRPIGLDLEGDMANDEPYQEDARRLGILPEGGPVDFKGSKLLQ